MSKVTILVPTLNEEQSLPRTIACLGALNPPADEMLLVDGGSEDATKQLAIEGGLTILSSPKCGRGSQINFGALHASGDIICVLHADSILPFDAVTEIRKAMDNPSLSLASFTPRIAGSNGTRWGSTVHNWLKTWYIPLLMRPWLFVKGVRLLFGDHAMFFRRDQFLEVGGCDEDVAVMEEADLCIKLARFGRTQMIARWVWTSDRRIAAWGRWRANWIYVKVGMMWAMGARKRLADHYPDVR